MDTMTLTDNARLREVCRWLDALPADWRTTDRSEVLAMHLDRITEAVTGFRLQADHPWQGDEDGHNCAVCLERNDTFLMCDEDRHPSELDVETLMLAVVAHQLIMGTKDHDGDYNDALIWVVDSWRDMNDPVRERIHAAAAAIVEASLEWEKVEAEPALTEDQRRRFEAAAMLALVERRADYRLGLLRRLTVAADRLIEGWAEGDDARKTDLWRGLSTATAAAHEVVYPLPVQTADHLPGCTMDEHAIDCDPALEGCPCWCHGRG